MQECTAFAMNPGYRDEPISHHCGRARDCGGGKVCGADTKIWECDDDRSYRTVKIHYGRVVKLVASRRDVSSAQL